MDDVVAAALAEQVSEHADAEDDRWQHAPPPAPRVERHPRAGFDDPDAGNVGVGATIPLTQSEEGHVVARLGQPLGNVPVPALGSADRVRVQAVVDDADTHGAYPHR